LLVVDGHLIYYNNGGVIKDYNGMLASGSLAFQVNAPVGSDPNMSCTEMVEMVSPEY